MAARATVTAGNKDVTTAATVSIPAWAARKKHVSAVPASTPLITHGRQHRPVRAGIRLAAIPGAPGRAKMFAGRSGPT
jgi:hypothetical protein